MIEVGWQGVNMGNCTPGSFSLLSVYPPCPTQNVSPTFPPLHCLPSPPHPLSHLALPQTFTHHYEEEEFRLTTLLRRANPVIVAPPVVDTNKEEIEKLKEEMRKSRGTHLLGAISRTFAFSREPHYQSQLNLILI
jgi:hypothetical protein